MSDRPARGAVQVANGPLRDGNGRFTTRAELRDLAVGDAGTATGGPGPEREVNSVPGERAPGRVVLSVGWGYFQDGKATTDRYAKDLAPTFVAALEGARRLLNAAFLEHGAQTPEITCRCGQWEIRFGPGDTQVELVELTVPTDGTVPRGVPDRRLGPWLRGVAADREGDHAAALQAFAKEADDAASAGVPQRAAVAYRSAATAARQAGRSDEANRLIRLAGKAYLEIAEAPETAAQGVFMAYREAARCLLDAGNLPLAHATLAKALATGQALGLLEST